MTTAMRPMRLVWLAVVLAAGLALADSISGARAAQDDPRLDSLFARLHATLFMCSTGRAALFMCSTGACCFVHMQHGACCHRCRRSQPVAAGHPVAVGRGP